MGKPRQPNLLKYGLHVVMMTWIVPVVAGCTTIPQAPDCDTVSQNLSRRAGLTIPSGNPASLITLPPGASLEDGLTEDEAVSIALWNNAAFQELLVDLGIARSDLIQAGLLPNPEFVYYWPVSDKPFKYLFDFPIESIWLRPIRLRTAAREADRAAERLTQAGLDLMRDVRQAYADAVLAKERVKVAAKSVELRTRIAELAEKRFKAGDISEQEAATARIDALQAGQDAAKIGFDVPLFEERLKNLMGIGPVREPLTLDPAPPPSSQTIDVETLANEAMGSRPDALAAAEAVAAARARLRFAKLGWVRFLGIDDATSGHNGHEFGPAMRFTLPIFNWNEGAIARAEAELERLQRNQKTVAYQIILDVHRAALQYQQTCAEYEILRTKVRPEVQAALERSQAAYQEGNVPIFIVLETTRQLLDNRLREAQLHGDLRRFWAELERSVGHKIAPAEAGPPPKAAPKSESNEAPRLPVPDEGTRK